MPLPAALSSRLKLPLIAAPMFLISNPTLVRACCQAGIMGTFPALNQRTTAGYADWLRELADTLGPEDAPYGVNLIVHKTNSRLEADLKVTVDHKVPVVITSLGAVRDVVDAVHSYGGLVFHDVINTRHAEKAIDAGVDGIIAVCAGAGGHGGTLSPFALSHEIRQIFDGTLIVSGALSTGAHMAAVRAMGADLAYMGTRFIATAESPAPAAYKQMVLGATAKDIVYTPAISGIWANFLAPSLQAHGLDTEALKATPEINVDEELGQTKAWVDIWSAGQGCGAIQNLPTVNDLCADLSQQMRMAIESLAP